MGYNFLFNSQLYHAKKVILFDVQLKTVGDLVANSIQKK